jgi:peptidoglycan/xylan/chitin deacetylase (PgdA/CDA1 family)
MSRSAQTLAGLAWLFFVPTLVYADPAPRLGILRSRQTQAALEQSAWGRGLIEREVQAWERLATRADVPYRIVGDYEITHEPQHYDALILPYPAFSDAAMNERLLGLVENARRVLLIGGDLENGRGFLQRLSVVCELPRPARFEDGKGRFMVLAGRSELALDVRPAFRFELQAGAPMYHVDSKGGQAFYASWGLDPVRAGTRYEQWSAVVHTRCGATELTWLGFPLSALVDNPGYRAENAALGANLIRALAGMPRIGKVAWPGDQDVAFVVTADVEADFDRAAELARILRLERVTGSLFLLGEEAKAHPEVVRALAAVGEVGSHSMGHGHLTQMSAAEEEADIRASRAALEALGVKPVLGFRPPFEEYDRDTLDQLAANGFKLVYGLNDYRYSYPHKVETKHGGIYQIPRIVRDDYNIFREKGRGDPLEDYVPAFSADLAKIERLSGIFPLSVHTNYLLRPDQIAALELVIRDARTRSTWFTTFGRIVSWVETRELVRVWRTGRTWHIRNDSGMDLNGFPLAAYGLEPGQGDEKSQKFLVVPRRGGGHILALHLAPQETITLQEPTPP